MTSFSPLMQPLVDLSACRVLMMLKVKLFFFPELLRKDLLRRESQMFSGTFSTNCQQSSVPESLMTLVSMIMNCPSIDSDADSYSQPVLSISQLLAFNTCSKYQAKSGMKKHTKLQESPLPIFVGTYILRIPRRY